MDLNRKYRYRITIILFISVLCLSGYRLKAEDSIDRAYYSKPQPIITVDSNKWEQAKKGLDFTPEKPTLKQKEQALPKEKDKPLDPRIIWVLKVLMYVLVIGGLLALVIWLISNTVFTKNTVIKRSSIEILNTVEENLTESDVDLAMLEALSIGDYKLAIRLQYLKIIKELTLLKWIAWQREKTNYQYLRELGNRPEALAFQNITNIFERAWYSCIQIDESSYVQLSPLFESLIQQLKKGGANA